MSFSIASYHIVLLYPSTVFLLYPSIEALFFEETLRTFQLNEILVNFFRGHSPYFMLYTTHSDKRNVCTLGPNVKYRVLHRHYLYHSKYRTNVLG